MRSFVLSLVCLGIVAATPLTGRQLAELGSAEPNIFELAQSTPELSTLVAAVIAADLVDVFSSPGPFTLLAPSNDAFDSLPPGELARLLLPENRAELVSILLYHTANGAILTDDLSDGQIIETNILGGSVRVRLFGSLSFSGGPLSFYESMGVNTFSNIAAVEIPDLRASNGVVHILGVTPGTSGAPRVLRPPQNIVALAQSIPEELSTLVTVINAAGAAGALSSPGEFTVFAPTNAAFEALPAGTLEFFLQPENFFLLAQLLFFHVTGPRLFAEDLTLGLRIPVDGATRELLVVRPENDNGNAQIRGGAPTNIATIVSVFPSLPISAILVGRDMLASNGLVHIVDNVLLPPGGYGSWANFTGLNNITGLSNSTA